MPRRKVLDALRVRLSVSVPEPLAQQVNGAALVRRQAKTVLYEQALQTYFDPNALSISLGQDLGRDIRRLSELTKVSVSDIALNAIEQLVKIEREKFGDEFAFQETIPFGPYG